MPRASYDFSYFYKEDFVEKSTKLHLFTYYTQSSTRNEINKHCNEMLMIFLFRSSSASIGVVPR